MTRANPLLTRRAVVRAQIEDDYGVAEVLGDGDGVLVSEPAFEVDPNVLERDIVTPDLSPLAIVIGRKLARMTFTTELRSNGVSDEADPTRAPMLSRLFRGCGYAMTAMRSPEAKGPYDIEVHDNPVVWAVSSGAKAQGTLTISDNPTEDETVTIGAVTYVFKAAPAAPYEVDIGADAEGSAANLAAAINGTGVGGTTYGAGTEAHSMVTAAAVAGVVTVTARAFGTPDNTIATTTDALDSAWGGGTLSGGTNVGAFTDLVAYYLEVTTGGASGVAEITVTSDTNGEGNAPAVVTDGLPFVVGSLGLTITPDFVGDLELGQRWIVWGLPTGLRLDPISDGFESLTIDMNKDGVLHTMPGAYGTFDIEAEAGQYGSVNFEFTGVWNTPVDAPLSNPSYERTLPAQVELARLRIDDFNAIVANFTYDQANEITVRPDVSSKEGYIGTRITSRAPEGGIDPEAELVGDHNFWDRMAEAKRMPFQMRVGTNPGNRVWMLAPVTQYTGLTYQDRDDILSYDAGLKFSRYTGNDEFCFVFC